jgi:hypothetical protein
MCGISSRGFRLNHLSNDRRTRLLLLLSRLAIRILSVRGTTQQRASGAER